MVFDLLLIPLLNGQITQGTIINPTDPAALTTHQDPVRRPRGFTGLQAHLAHPTKGLIGFQHAECTPRSLLNLQILKNLLQEQHLGFTAVGSQAKPTNQDEQ